MKAVNALEFLKVGSISKKNTMKIILIILFVMLMPACSLKTRSGARELLEEANALSKKAVKLYEAMNFNEAIPIAKKSLEIYVKVLGKDHLDVGRSLLNLSSIYQGVGLYTEAEPLYKKSLEILELNLGKEHPDVGITLNNLASLYNVTGRYAEAEPLYKRALEIWKKVFGKDYPEVGKALNNLAVLYHETGRYADAEPLYKKSLEIRVKALGEDHLDVSTTLNNLADLYHLAGRYAEVEPLYKRALEIREKTLSKNHPDIALSLNNLAVFYGSTYRISEAEPLYKRALEIREKTLGKDHPDVANTLSNMAELYKLTGRYSEAEPLYKRALEIREKALGKDHPDVARTLSNMAGFYELTGRHSEAEPLCIRSLAIREKTLGKDHPDVAETLNNIASLYMEIERYSEAEPLYKRALEIREKTLGKDHPDVASTLSNLAILYNRIGKYVESEALYKRALEIWEKVFGKDHYDVGIALNNLASLYNVTGRYAEAEALYKRALEIWEKVFGKDHRDVAKNLISQAILNATLGKNIQASMFFTRCLAIESSEREEIFLLLSEKQKLKYMEQNKDNLHTFITHTYRKMKDNKDITDAINVWLRWKGSVLEAQRNFFDAAYGSENPGIKIKIDELNTIRLDIAKLQISKPEKIAFEEYKKAIESLQKKKELLETELTVLSKDFALEKKAGKADTKKIAEILSKDSVYIDFAAIRMFNFKEKRFDEQRYLAFILIPDREPVVKLIDLVDIKEVDKSINEYLKEMKDAARYQTLPRNSLLSKRAQEVYNLIMKPLEPYIKDKKQLFISPDGNLNLIPFEVLMTQDGKYLMEDYIINYVGAGRDIVRFTDTNTAKGQALIMADPDYNMGFDEKEKIISELRLAKVIRGSISRDISKLSFAKLPDTKKEADSIAEILKGSNKLTISNYQNKKAVEEILFSREPPMILHLATHGYFLKSEEVKKDDRFLMEEQNNLPALNIENPMLRSGIVLAGINASLKEGRDDGMVTAEKILGLRLKGTDLVVLSACETGVGDVKNGEGVFGLKRAFILSGAKTLVMSLWSVPSAETTELMTDFYVFMSKGKTKSEALRQAKLNMMAKKPNPFFWGAFVMTGKPE